MTSIHCNVEDVEVRMPKRRPRRLDQFAKVLTGLGQLGPLITALATAVLAGRSMGWW